MPDEPTKSETPSSSDPPPKTAVPVEPVPRSLTPERPEAQETNVSTTGFVPSFRAPVPGDPRALASKRHPVPGELPCPGQKFGDDFEIVQVLGAGAFATVFLARQISLDRQVALKVSANRGGEARTLARLEHDHIVRVFSEDVDAERNQRLLCMQFVAGTTLEKIIEKLSQREPNTWSGRAILEIIDALSTHPAVFDPAAVRDREQLLSCDFVEAVCWIGTRLAEALAHAHNQGVLHRDVKPANILMNRYGRPMLADFNVSLDPDRAHGPAGAVFGGTLGYMAPEHIDAFNPAEKNTTAAAVDERSDIYSLGLVLYEMLVGKLPFEALPKTTKVGDFLRLLAGQRRSQVVAPGVARPDIPGVLDRAVRRCLAPDPARRYQSATELAEALKGCFDYRRMEKDLPRGGRITRATLRQPLLVGLLLIFLPHMLGTAVNILYNTLRIARDHLDVPQQIAFIHVTWAYTVVVFTPAILITLWLMAPILRVWRQLDGPDIADDAEVARVRRHALKLPAWDVFLSCLGWLPGGFVVPFVIHCCAGIEPELYLQFAVGCTISGLIALTYSMFAVQFLALRVLYPHLWVDARGLQQQSRDELRPLDRRLGIFQLMAGLIPLTGAVLMTLAGPDQYGMFRLLLTALIFLGMVGFAAALAAGRQLQQIFAALIGSERHRPDGRSSRSTIRDVRANRSETGSSSGASG